MDDERKGVRGDQVEKLQNILAVLNRARVPSDMDVPGLRLQHAFDVDLIDYH